MKGTRPLDNDEIRSVSTCFTGTYEVRNRGLFMLGVSPGGRISEMNGIFLRVWWTLNFYFSVLHFWVDKKVSHKKLHTRL